MNLSIYMLYAILTDRKSDFHHFMPRPSFANDNFYHVYNRGTDKRKIFQDQEDHQRFIHDLFEFNDANSVINILRRFTTRTDGSPTSYQVRKPRKLLVDVVSFCLMPNHYHLLLRQRKDGGLSKFIQKLGTGYTHYFNQKYQRSGVLFQGKFKAIHITDDEYLTHLSRYIHLNPLELKYPEYKEKGIKDWSAAATYLGSYHWSSYLDYIGIPTYPSVTHRDFLLQYFDGQPLKYEKFVREWTTKSFHKISNFSLDP